MAPQETAGAQLPLAAARNTAEAPQEKGGWGVDFTTACPARVRGQALLSVLRQGPPGGQPRPPEHARRATAAHPMAPQEKGGWGVDLTPACPARVRPQALLSVLWQGPPGVQPRPPGWSTERARRATAASRSSEHTHWPPKRRGAGGLTSRRRARHAGAARGCFLVCGKGRPACSLARLAGPRSAPGAPLPPAAARNTSDGPPREGGLGG